MEYSVGFNPLTSNYVSLPLSYVNSVNQYGNYSITLTNSNGSTTTTFQVLPPGKSTQIYFPRLGIQRFQNLLRSRPYIIKGFFNLGPLAGVATCRLTVKSAVDSL